MAAGEGFEPSQNDPESFVLPLHNPAILKQQHYSIPKLTMQLYFLFI